MKRLFLIPLAVVLLLGLIFDGCAAPSPAPTPAPSPAPAKPIEMKFASTNPPLNYASIACAQWIEEVDKRLGGRVKITYFGGSQLGGPMEAYKMLRDGVSDISAITGSYIAREFPLIDWSDVPYLLPSDWDKRQAVASEIFYRFLTGEHGFGESKVLQMHVVGTTTLHTTGKAVRKLEDLNGLQIRTPPGLLKTTIEALGATPATIPLPEVYSALEKKMVDGLITGWTGVVGYKMEEVLDYHIDIRISTSPHVWVMNLKTWNSLPPDIQKTFEEELMPLGLKISNSAFRQAEEDAVSTCKAVGNEIIHLSPDEIARWVQATAYIADEWAAGIDAKGLPGTEIVKATRELVAAK